MSEAQMGGPAAEDGLAAELYSVAENAAAEHGRSFKPNVSGLLQSLMQQAASEVLNPNKFGSRSALESYVSIDERTQHAKTAVQNLVNAMVAHANTVPGYAAGELGETTLGGAMSPLAFCPCWPFC